MLPKVFFSH